MSWLSDITGGKGRKEAREDIQQGINRAQAKITFGYRGARNYLTDARNNVIGRVNTGYGSAINLARSGYRSAMDNVASGYQGAEDLARGGYQGARSDIGGAYGTARGDISGGFQGAMDRLNTGYNTGISNIRDAYGRGIGSLREGYGRAQGYYDNPEMAMVRNETMRRVQGEGGFSPEVLEKMKAGAREEFGGGLRGVQQSLSSYFGDSSAGGLAGENLARAGAELSGRRAAAIRDIDIQNAMLTEDQKTQAMQAMREEAYQRAGLSADEARILAQMETEQGRISGGMEAERGRQLADLESRLGSGLATLATQEGAALAGLSTDEANFLSNLSTQRGIAIGDLMQQQGLTEADLTREQTQFLMNVDDKYGANLANLSTEEAAMLAQIFTGGGAAIAGTRDTAGIMPLLSEFARGAGQAAVTASSRDAKEDITPMTARDHEKNLWTISNMPMVRYRYKEEYRDASDNGKLHTGLIAEEAPEEIATTGKDKLHIGDMVGMALSAIKALSGRVEVLEGKSDAI